MSDCHEQGKPGILVHWTYSPEEWKRFMKWKRRKNNIFSYLLYILLPKQKAKIPYVIITHTDVRAEDAFDSFSNNDRLFKHVDIHDAGPINVLEILYENINNTGSARGQIFLPVPKGKLREAIQLQAHLQSLYCKR